MPYTYEYDEETESLKRKYISPDPQKALIQKHGGKRKYNEWLMIKNEAKINEYNNIINELKTILSMNQIYEWNLEEYKKQHIQSQ